MTVRSSTVVALMGAVAALATSGEAAAQTHPYQQVEPERRWRVDVGGGVVHGFSPSGDTGRDVNLTAWGSADYRGIVYANGLDGLGWNALRREDLRIGVQIRPRFAAGDIEGTSLARPGLGADAAAYVYKRLPGNIVVGGRFGHDVTGDDAGVSYNVSVGHQRVTPVGLLNLSGYLDGGDADRANHYFGVSPTAAPGSGYTVYQPDGGLSAAGVAALLAVPIGDRFGVGGFVNYERRLGDVRSSPLVDDEHQWRAGLIFVARFTSRD